jgi:Rad3-related DNA helicase
MVSIDHYRQDLRTQLARATANGAVDILINAGELCRKRRRGIAATDASCRAMKEEMKPGDVVLIEAGAGVGMTVRYLLPRDGQQPE